MDVHIQILPDDRAPAAVRLHFGKLAEGVEVDLDLGSVATLHRELGKLLERTAVQLRPRQEGKHYRGLSPLEVYRRQERETEQMMQDWRNRLDAAGAGKQISLPANVSVHSIDGPAQVSKETIPLEPGQVYYGGLPIGLVQHQAQGVWMSASDTPAPNELDEDATAWFQRMMSQD